MRHALYVKCEHTKYLFLTMIGNIGHGHKQSSTWLYQIDRKSSMALCKTDLKSVDVFTTTHPPKCRMRVGVIMVRNVIVGVGKLASVDSVISLLLPTCFNFFSHD